MKKRPSQNTSHPSENKSQKPSGAADLPLHKLILFSVITFAAAASVYVVFLEIQMRTNVPESLKDIAQAKNAEAMRDSSRYIRSSDSVLIYENRPGYNRDGFVISEHGIIGKAHTVVDRTKRVVRILILGDSIGNGGFSRKRNARIRQDETYPALLERLLNTLSITGVDSVEVLNFSTDGYGTMQQARLLQLKAGAFMPDLIIWQYCINDPGTSSTPAIYFFRPNIAPLYLIEYLRRNVRFGQYSVLAATPVPTHGPFSKNAKVRKYWRLLYHPGSPTWKSVLKGMQIVSDYSRQHSIPVLLVIFPLRPAGRWGDGFAKKTHLQVRAAALKSGFKCADLIQVFSRFPPDRLYEPKDIYHLTDDGHRLTAMALAQYLKANQALLVPKQKQRVSD